MLEKEYRPLWLMSLVTLFGFPLLAWPLMWYQDISWSSIFHLSKKVWFYLPLSLSLGIFFGLIMIYLTELQFFDKALSSIRNRLKNIKLTTFFVVTLSICAGVGEEIFFRAALQPLLGVWLTSLIFVSIHGYFSLKNSWLNLFGLLLFLFIVFIGWLAKEYSLWIAILAHFSYDLVLLFYYKKEQQAPF
ncbi:MAG: CPBP family glutamic-type intramembrane protease [Crocinitomicaceae bacterium]